MGKQTAQEDAVEQQPTVKVYVRKGDGERERTVSINVDRAYTPSGTILADLDQEYLMEVGFAIDGNSATVAVRAGTRVVHAPWDADRYFAGDIMHDAAGDVPDAPGVIEQPGADYAGDLTLQDSLLLVQRFVKDLLRRMGYQARFV